MADEIEYIPITTEEAVEAVLNGAWLYRAEIPDLRALIEGIDAQTKLEFSSGPNASLVPDYRVPQPGEHAIRCVACRVVDCDCQKLQISAGLNLASRWPVGRENVQKPSTVFVRTADFEDSTFLAAFESTGARFTEDAEFNGCRFKENAVFGNTVFEGDARFSWVVFEKGAGFSDAQFSKATHFGEIVCSDVGAFDNTMFRGGAGFESARFEGDAVFWNARFEKPAEFSSAEFGADTSFEGAHFKEEAGFKKASFINTPGFLGASLSRGIDFTAATFGDGAEFRKLALDGPAQFRRAKIGGTLRFGDVELRCQVHLDFADADLRPGGHIQLSIDQIGRSGRKLIEGEDRKDRQDLGSAAAQYNMLRDNFRTLPSTDDEEDHCHYKYMDLRRRASEWSWARRFTDWLFLKWCWGYGIYTKRIVATIAVVILGFGAIYHMLAGPETIRNYCIAPSVSSAEGNEAADPDCPTEFHPWYFSIITFTTIGYGDYAPRGSLRWVAGLEGLLGLMLMAVFTVSFARKFIR